jgi:uncharacterized protein (TIGR03083 family)
MTLLGREESLAAIDREATALLVAAASAPDADVPSCPEWTNDDLVGHLARVHRFWAEVVRQRVGDVDDLARLDDPDNASASPDPVAARALLLDALRSTPDDTAVWTWADDQSVGFVRRFQVVEATVHRVDAEQAAGRSFELDPATCVHAIDVTLETLSLRRVDGVLPGTVHLHCTDADGEWIVERDGTVRTGHEKGDAAMRGRAQDLLLVLWRRVGLDAVDIPGSREVADALIAADPRA